MSVFAPSAHEASLLEVATLVFDQDADAHEAVDQEAAPHEAVFQEAALQDADDQEAEFQDASAFAAFDQLAASKTRPEPPAGSETTYLLSARFGFGGELSAAALSALISPTPSELGAAGGGG